MTKQMDDDHRLMPLFYPDFIDQNSSEMSRVQILLRESKGKGLTLMYNILNRYDHNTILNHGVSWLKISSSVAIESNADDEVRKLASSTFTLLIKQAAKLPEASRDVANNVIPTIIDRIVQLKKQEFSVLVCLNAIMEFFPRASEFKAKRGKICKYLIPIMFGLNVKKQELAIKCWSLMCRLGSGGGHDNQVFVDDWKLQMKEIVGAMEYYQNMLILKKGDELDCCYGYITLPLPKLPQYEPELSYVATQRFLVLCKCLPAVLQSGSLLNSAVDVPLGEIFNVCNNVITSGGKKQASFTCEFRWELERSSLRVIKEVVIRCRSYCRKYCEVVNNLLRRVVYLHDNYRKKSLKLRALYYDVIARWVEGCDGIFTNFISYENEDLPLMTTMTLDATCTSFDESLTSDSMAKIVRNSHNNQQKRSNKKKKSVVDDVTMHSTTGVLFDEDSRVELSRNSLGALRHIILSFGDVLQQAEHEKCRIHLHKSILDLVKSIALEEKSTVLYQKHPELRKEIYQVLRALVLLPNGPITQASRYFTRAATLDNNCDVKSFCYEASLMTSALMRPRVVKVAVNSNSNKYEDDDSDDDEEEKVEQQDASCQTEEIATNKQQEETLDNNNGMDNNNESEQQQDDDDYVIIGEDELMCTDDVTVDRDDDDGEGVDVVTSQSPSQVETVAEAAAVVEEPVTKKRKVSTDEADGSAEEEEQVSKLLALFDSANN